MERSGLGKHALYVGEGVTVDGSISSDGIIEVLGMVTGEITANEVRIASGGRVDGTIKAKTLDVSGEVGSVVDVIEKLTVRASGRVVGDVIYGSIQIDAGASIMGTIRQQGKEVNHKHRSQPHLPPEPDQSTQSQGSN